MGEKRKESVSSHCFHNKEQNVAILLWGQRRIGKTSFVLRLKEYAAGAFLPIYIDLQGLKDASTAMFLHLINGQDFPGTQGKRC